MFLSDEVEIMDHRAVVFCIHFLSVGRVFSHLDIMRVFILASELVLFSFPLP